MGSEPLFLVVLSYGDGPVDELVGSLIRTGAPAEQLVVVHNPSPSMPEPRTRRPGVRVICRVENLGYGAGMNAGRAAALAEAPAANVALITHDVAISYPDVVALAAELDKNPCIGVIAPRLDSPSGGTMSTGGSLDRWGNIKHLTTANGPGPEPRDWVDGAVLVVSHRAPPLPEQYFLYMEDVAYCVRVRKAGLEVCCLPSAVAVTDPQAGHRRELFRYLYWRNRLAFARTDLTPSATVAGVARLLAAATARSAQLVLSERRFGPSWKLLRTYQRALFDGLTLRLGAPAKPSAAVPPPEESTRV